MNVDHALTLLGGLTPRQFMRRHWQKKPLLIRQAMPAVQPPVGRAELFALAARDDVESRLVSSKPRGRTTEWSLRHGPFTRRQLPPLGQAGWTLLVQGLDLHVEAAHALRNLFRFVPEARLDDVMISYASDGGGVGPHTDSYDVFLLQVSGRRRWRCGPVKHPAPLVPGMPVKILADFAPTEDWVLEPGDMLYLPPRWGHDGIALGNDCMTCSIGFRTPTPTDLAREVLQRMTDALDPSTDEPHYRDPADSATETPGLIPSALQTFAAKAVIDALNDANSLACALGEVLTEPKSIVWFDGDDSAELTPGRGVRLDQKSRMMYDAQHVFINGESFRAAGRDARLMRQLADARRLGSNDLAQLSEGALALVQEWLEAGWLRGDDGQRPD